MNSFLRNYLKNKVAGYVHDEIKDFDKFHLFNMGESFIAPSEKVRKILENYPYKKLGAYLDPTYKELRSIIAKKLGVDINNIMLTVGADEAINLIPRAIAEPKDSSVIAVPTFYRIVEANLMFKVKNYFVATKEEENFSYDGRFAGRFIAEINRKKATTAWICNPNNPTGNVISQNNLLKILKNINKKCVLIIDEVFFDFYDPTNKKSAVALIKKFNNLIVVRSLSKSYSLAGIRLGFVVSNEKLIDSINLIKPVFNINALSEDAAKAALQDSKYIEMVAKKTKMETKKLLDLIKKMRQYIIGGETVTNVFLLKHKDKDIFEELKKRKILTADFRNSCGLENRGYVRITVQGNKKNSILLKALKDIG